MTVAAVLVVVVAGATAAVASNGTENDKTFEFTVGLWGDLPYNDVQEQTGVPISSPT